MTPEEWEKLYELYNEMAKTDAPPPGCEMKEISPNVFAWVKRADDSDSNTTE